ncbi:MAG: HAMP domain-containing histidine kinase [Deltaproteobacteria bacterium]|nr:HAMP domain-containing histidine kinase [Deltaproteobacteria bacterium]
MIETLCRRLPCCWFLAGSGLVVGLVFGLLFIWFNKRQQRLRREIGLEERREAQLWIEIDRRREVEARLEQYQARLEVMVEERTRALEESQKEILAQAFEIGRAQMAAMVLHNIGNALTPVTIFVEELKNDDSDPLLVYLENCFAEIKEHAADPKNFIESDRGRQIFAYSNELLAGLRTRQRLRTGQIDEVKEAVDRVVEILLLQQDYASAGGALEESVEVDCLVVLEDAIRVLEGSFAKRRITLQRDFGPSLPPLFVDKGGLLRVLVILLKNSFEAIDEKLAAGFDCNDERWVALTAGCENGELFLTFCDSGIGFAAEAAEKLFNFGYSAKGASGFGLYYCREWLGRHHGRITLTSPGPGLGAKVEISLPIA